MLSKILCVDPLKRYKVDQILEHNWCTMIGSNFVAQGLIVGYHRMPIDEDIINTMVSYDYDQEYSKKCIDANKHNHITTAYYLLLKKKLKEGKDSPADISSEKFDYEQVQPLNRRTNAASDARLSTGGKVRVRHIKSIGSDSGSKNLKDLSMVDVSINKSLKKSRNVIMVRQRKSEVA
jgi:5'-AMP-activated protein kinase catalytic alpha subunit